MVERARIILAYLDGKEIQQVARDLSVSVVTVAKWRSRFALFGARGLQDGLRPGKPPKYGIEFRNRFLKLLEGAIVSISDACNAFSAYVPEGAAAR
jgi:transposase